MAKTLFDLIKGVTKNKIKWESLTKEDQQMWNNFIITRWFSMEMEITDTMNDFQKYSNGILTSKYYYKLLYDILPKTTFYLKYIKKKKKIEIDPQFVDLFSQHYQLSKMVIFEYITDLVRINPNELVSVLKSYGTKQDDLEKFKKQIKTLQ